MSFSKAKLLRFNEVQSCAPPPGAYNPKIKSHVPSVVIAGSQKLAESPVEGAAGSNDATPSTPCFKTPVRFRKISSASERKAKAGKLLSPKASTIKEKYIAKINALNDKLAKSAEENEKLKEKNAALGARMAQMENDLTNFKEESEHRGQQLLELTLKVKNGQKEIVQLIESRNEDVNELESRYVKSLKNLDDLRRSHESELKSIRGKHSEEIEKLEMEVLSAVIEWQKLKERNEMLQSLVDGNRETGANESDYEKLLAEKHSYEVTLKNTLATVDALKNRLLNSDRDVEQLKEEVETLEASKLEMENRCVQLKQEATRMRKELENLKSDYDTVVKDEIEEMRLQLIAKVDKVALENKKRINCMKAAFKEEIAAGSALLVDSHRLIDKANEKIDELIEVNTEYLLKNNSLESLVKNLQDKIDSFEKHSNDLQIEETATLTLTIFELKAKNDKLYAELESLKAVEQEKLALENTVKVLKQKLEKLENVDLLKSEELSEVKNELEKKLCAQNKTIDKLKLEITMIKKSPKKSTAAEGKENVPSPLRAQTGWEGAQMPLRDRN